ncbi:MAG: methyltransferase domain-containing protein [Candidatus Nanoarchaeia archaeon]|jgi:2-polyprenyl-3-methyl-5-hydroxy-6-metoxy-1,4-benzoquinol methylase
MRCKSIEDEKKHLSTNPIMKFVLKKFKQDIIETASMAFPQNILDVGCGNGFITKEIAKAFPNSKITAVDIEQEKIDYAKRHNNAHNVKYLQGNMFHLPFKKNSFDLVICNEVLEHLADYNKAINILAGLSSRYLLVSVPNEPLFRIATFMRGKHLRTWGNMPGHVNNWNKRQIVNLLKPHGGIIKVLTSTVWNIVLIKKNEAKHGL